jgi:hypothetical protein
MASVDNSFFAVNASAAPHRLAATVICSCYHEQTSKLLSGEIDELAHDAASISVRLARAHTRVIKIRFRH